jgi:hypothetical protein
MDKFTEELMKKTATDMAMDEEMVRKIISFQFKDMLRAARSSRHIEMTWFGKWYTSNGKCRNKIVRLSEMEQAIEARLNSGEDLTEARISNYNSKLRAIRSTIEFLRSKMDYEVRHKGTAGGNVEYVVCEAGSRGDLETEDGDLQGMFTQLGPPEEV